MANFGDRYELTERIGSGGTGEVWLALDERLGGRPVAIKIMHRHVRPASGDDGRFEHELRRAAQLDHPNIVDIYATGTYRDASFLVMEYLEGHDLDMALPGDEPGRVAAVGRDICGALAYAHGQGVIHGGIKPGNAVLRGTGRVKVTDFGLAQAVRASAPGSSAPPDGMLAYLSPEQWRGEAPAFSDDVWSAGCILYRLVSGRLPRVLPGAAEYTAAARRGDPVPDLRRVSAAPDWLAGAVMAMLDPDAARRVTADECIRLLSGPPSPATALTRPAPGWLLPGQYGSGDPGTGRLPVTAAAAAGGGRGRGRVISAVAVAVLLLVAGSVAAWQLSSASRTSPPTLSRAVTTSPTAPASGQAPVPSVSRSGSAAADSPRGTSASPARSLPASPPGPRPAPASGSRSARPAPSGSSPAPRPGPPSGAPPGSPAPLPSGPPGTSGSAPPPGGPPPGGGPPPTGGPPPGGGPPPTGGPPGGPPPGGPPPNAADTAA